MDQVQVAGPQLPPQTTGSPVKCASAPAAKAATSSVTDNAVDSFNSRRSEGVRKLISNSSWHVHNLLRTGATQAIAIPAAK
jgi:hypothetical protein